MNRNQEKKKAERLVLSAARKAGAPIPSGELVGEEPDFSFLAPDGSLGIEVTEVLRPRSSNHGISPVESSLTTPNWNPGLGRDDAPLNEKVLHQYRIAGKRARYIAELAGDNPQGQSVGPPETKYAQTSFCRTEL